MHHFEITRPNITLIYESLEPAADAYLFQPNDKDSLIYDGLLGAHG
jgi:hypothetical protein